MGSKIPGSRKLKSSQAICEKHFQDYCIIREYIGKDSNGTVIARVPLKKARLVKSSVPTRFTYHSDIINQCDKENNLNSTNDDLQYFNLKLHEPDLTFVKTGIKTYRPKITTSMLLKCENNKTADVITEGSYLISLKNEFLVTKPANQSEYVDRSRNGNLLKCSYLTPHESDLSCVKTGVNTDGLKTATS
ncbi:uncharacterized protein LOC117180941 [Belonocnema kinseyi]|uniref:uncharacterized protein LOC117180941 n=1 Tax=Belonocnema kinseyi TaxID=2817044 RepID=UPI00143DD682|nr:uncharacterized protein LOC117180941 [Belonocnema kinseyi]